MPSPALAMLAFLGLPSAASIAKAIVDVAISVALKLLAAAVKSLLDALFGFMAATTEPVFTSGWWTGSGHRLWLEVLSVSGGIMALALMLAALEAMWSGTAAPIARALGAIPMAVVKTAALVGVTSLLISGSDQVANYFDGSIVTRLGAVPALIAAAVSDTDVVGMIFAAVIVFAVLGLWAELAVRAATIYLVVMTAPMVIAASVHPRLRDSWRRLAEIGAGLIFSKVLVALAFAVAFSELEGLSASPSFSQAVGALVGAISTLLLSCFAPFVLFRLFSLEVAHLEGLARRPGRAARDSQQIAYYSRGGITSFLNRHGAPSDTGGAPGAPGSTGGSPPRGGGPGRSGGGDTLAGGPRPGGQSHSAAAGGPAVAPGSRAAAGTAGGGARSASVGGALTGAVTGATRGASSVTRLVGQGVAQGSVQPRPEHGEGSREAPGGAEVERRAGGAGGLGQHASGRTARTTRPDAGSAPAGTPGGNRVGSAANHDAGPRLGVRTPSTPADADSNATTSGTTAARRAGPERPDAAPESSGPVVHPAGGSVGVAVPLQESSDGTTTGVPTATGATPHPGRLPVQSAREAVREASARAPGSGPLFEPATPARLGATARRDSDG